MPHHHGAEIALDQSNASVNTLESDKVHDDDSIQSGQTPSIKSPCPIWVRKANPRIFGDEWVNGTFSLTPHPAPTLDISSQT
jgi:hypothetical protein